MLNEPPKAATAKPVAASSWGEPAPENTPAPEPSAIKPEPQAAVDASLTFLPLDPFSVFFGMHGGVSWLNSAAAREHPIGAVGGSFYVSTGLVIFDLVTVTGTFGASFPSDSAS